MKIKDLPKGTNLGGVKVRTPDGKEGYWNSQWNKGVWLAQVPPGTSGSLEIEPIFVEDLKECLEWDIVEPSQPQSI